MASPWILAIDQGGHGTRALVFDPHGEEQARAQQEIAVRRGVAGRAAAADSDASSEDLVDSEFVEHDATELLASVDRVVAEALERSPQRPVAAGLATQRSSIACWNVRTGVPLAPIISWQDRRAAALLERCVAGRADEVQRRTGLLPSAHFGASKLRWCLDEIPAVRTAAERGELALGPLSSLIVQHLTGQPPVVDAANASRTMLWNIDTCDWDPALLEWFGIDLRWLPRSVPTVRDYGVLSACPDVALHAVNGDQSAALYCDGPVGQQVLINIGTGAFLQVPASAGARPRRLPRSVVCQCAEPSPGDATRLQHVVEGTVNGGAAALSWWRDERGVAADTLREELPDWLASMSSPPIFVNGVSGLGSPDWVADFASRFVATEDGPEACAATPATAIAAEAVAIVESIVFLLQRNLTEMEGVPGLLQADQPLRVAGGLSRLDGLCRRLASLAGRPVQRLEQGEATARGIAYLAGQYRAAPTRELTASAWHRSPTTSFEPRSDNALRARYERWRREMP